MEQLGPGLPLDQPDHRQRIPAGEAPFGISKDAVFDGGGRGENGAELPGGECFEGAEAAFEFDRGQAAQAIEAAQKIFRGGFAFLRVAFVAAGNQIAVGIASPPDKRDDMVEAAHTWADLAHAIEAVAPVALMNHVAPVSRLQKVHLL